MTYEERVTDLLSQMTLDEKIGQMWQIHGRSPENEARIRDGAAGSVLNLNGSDEKDPAAIANRYQRIAVEESRLGIPLIVGRDVIHGFRTIMPIPLGQAASFNPDIARAGAAVAAREARACGVHWTFTPMVDISRDPRWGRVAESCGEDPVLAARMGRAMVEGFQGDDMAAPDRIAACAKHYVGYGAAEGGRDYNTTWIPPVLLRNVYLPPFKACVDAGAATLMSAFNDLNGVPASGNEFTIRQVLKNEWGFDGFVVSDWGSVVEMIKHGFCADTLEAARAGVRAGVDMEMVSTCYRDHIKALLDQGELDMALINDAVRRVLLVKMRLGLFDNPYTAEDRGGVILSPEHVATAKRAALESCVLLKNDGVLPLSRTIRKLAVIGPLADAAKDQMGCWVPDGLPGDVVTPLKALRDMLSDECQIRYAPGLALCRSHDECSFDDAVAAAAASEAVVLFLGEDAVLSGEAHCRAYLGLPGAQAQLLKRVAETGKPVVVVIMAGRPLTLADVVDDMSALLFAWHPGTMGGPALAELLFGEQSPCGKLPVTFPRTVGQIPVYYAHQNTGRPPQKTGRPAGIPLGTPLDPVDFTSTYIDVECEPLFPFGFGLSYGQFEYSRLSLSSDALPLGGELKIEVDLVNTGRAQAVEVVQLYVQDVAASVTRPVRELKDFTRAALAPGEKCRIAFVLTSDQLGFFGEDGLYRVESGKFRIFVGGSSDAPLTADFELVRSFG